MAQAAAGDSVKVHYKGSLDDGTVFDSSEGREPLGFQIGAGQVIEGFETAVLGLEVGQSRTVTMPPEKAYGPLQPNLIIEVPKTELPEGMPLGVGQQLQAQSETGEIMVFTLVEEKETSVMLDANHELAGQSLTFEISLVEIG